MVEMERLQGRLGAQMFYWAFVRCFCEEVGFDHEFIPGLAKLIERHEGLIRSMYGGDIPPTQHGVVSLHVRRGDYLQPGSPFVDLWATDYYQRAMAMFPGARFLVFSDDINWCAQQELFRALWRGGGCEFSSVLSPVRDMNRMACCEHNIIANSCFSWWAAWLNPNPAKRVVAPAMWTRERATSVMSGWVTLDLAGYSVPSETAGGDEV